jgi:hypothetical protein
VTTILVDHDIEGQAALLWARLVDIGWPDLVPMRKITLAEVGLPRNSPDRVVWRFAQERQMLLLTNNRNATDDDSLSRTIREESTAASLPVLTIGNIRRIIDPAYRARCADRLMEVVLYPERYLGAGRIFIP